MNLDAPEDRVHTLLSGAVFGDHPLGREVLGEMPTVEAITRDDLAAFFERWYRPATMVVAVAGRLEHDAVVAMVTEAFAAGAGGEVPVRVAPADPMPVVAVERDDTEQAHLCLGWRSLDVSDDDRWALAVANQVLGGGMASRLFQEVREQRGLAYSVYSHHTGFQDSGYLSVYCGTGPQRAREALGVIDDVLAAVLADGVTEAELAVAAGYLEGSMLLGMEDSGGRMGRLGRSLMQSDRIITIDEHLARIRAVSVEDASRVLHRVLDGPRALAAVGPFETDQLVG
jgi:predicted Zn-dependent peptidase